MPESLRIPARGEIWDVDFHPKRGQMGRRPALVLSVDIFNGGPAGVVVLAPLTEAERKVRWHVPVQPSEGGAKLAGFVMCENVRSVSRKRLTRYRGGAGAAVMRAVEDRLRILLGL